MQQCILQFHLQIGPLSKICSTRYTQQQRAKNKLNFYANSFFREHQ